MKYVRFVVLAVCMVALLFGNGCLVRSKSPLIGHMPDVGVMDVTGEYLLYTGGSEPSQVVLVMNHQGNMLLYKNTVLESGKGTERALYAVPLSLDAMVVQAEEQGTFLYYLVEKTSDGFVRKDVDLEQYKAMAPQLGFPPVVEDPQGGEVVMVDSLSVQDLWDFYTVMRNSPGMMAEAGRFVRQ